MQPNLRMGTINLRQIEAFIAFIENGSVTRAAEAMRITQSAASRLLQRLEEDIGFSLFVRAGGRLGPTEDAKALYAEAQRSLAGLRQIEQAAQRIRDIGSGLLRICVMPTLQRGVVPRLLASFCGKHPGISVMMDVQSHHDVIQSVQRGMAELGFATFPIGEPGLVTTVLARNNAVCLLPMNHALARLRRVRVKDLQDVEYINVPRARFRDRVDRLFDDHGVRRRIRIEARTILAAMSLVAEGAGVTIGDPFSLELTKDSPVVQRPLLPALPIEVGAFHAGQQPLSVVGRAFLDHCVRSIEATLQA